MSSFNFGVCLAQRKARRFVLLPSCFLARAIAISDTTASAAPLEFNSALAAVVARPAHACSACRIEAHLTAHAVADFLQALVRKVCLNVWRRLHRRVDQIIVIRRKNLTRSLAAVGGHCVRSTDVSTTGVLRASTDVSKYIYGCAEPGDRVAGPRRTGTRRTGQPGDGDSFP